MMSPDERTQMSILKNDLSHLSRALSDIERRVFLALLLGYASLLGVIGLTISLIFNKVGAN